MTGSENADRPFRVQTVSKLEIPRFSGVTLPLPQRYQANTERSDEPSFQLTGRSARFDTVWAVTCPLHRRAVGDVPPYRAGANRHNDQTHGCLRRRCEGAHHSPAYGRKNRPTQWRGHSSRCNARSPVAFHSASMGPSDYFSRRTGTALSDFGCVLSAMSRPSRMAALGGRSFYVPIATPKLICSPRQPLRRRKSSQVSAVGSFRRLHARSRSGA